MFVLQNIETYSQPHIFIPHHSVLHQRHSFFFFFFFFFFFDSCGFHFQSTIDHNCIVLEDAASGGTKGRTPCTPQKDNLQTERGETEKKKRKTTHKAFEMTSIAEISAAQAYSLHGNCWTSAQRSRPKSLKIWTQTSGVCAR